MLSLSNVWSSPIIEVRNVLNGSNIPTSTVSTLDRIELCQQYARANFLGPLDQKIVELDNFKEEMILAFDDKLFQYIVRRLIVNDEGATPDIDDIINKYLSKHKPLHFTCVKGTVNVWNLNTESQLTTLIPSSQDYSYLSSR
jgi:hypothetical protein